MCLEILKNAFWLNPLSKIRRHKKPLGLYLAFGRLVQESGRFKGICVNPTRNIQGILLAY